MRDAGGRRRRLRPARDPAGGRPLRRRLRQAAGRARPGAGRDRRGPRPGHRLQRHPHGAPRRSPSSSPTAACAPGRTTRGCSKAEREDTQRAWMDDELDVVVATTAFGMGIDKPDTRFVIHAEPADSVDSYYQEIGRAGRDGEPALAVLVYRQEDLGLRRFFAAGTPAEEELQQVAGLVQAAAAAGIEDGVDVKDLREETGRAATPLARDLNLLEQVVGRRPGRGRRRAPGRRRAAARRGGRRRPRARRAPRAGRPEPRRDDARLRRDHRVPSAVPARLLRRAARRALRQLRQLLGRHGPGAPGRRRPRHPVPGRDAGRAQRVGRRGRHARRGRPARRPLRRGRLQDARASPPSPRTACSGRAS